MRKVLVVGATAVALMLSGPAEARHTARIDVAIERSTSARGEGIAEAEVAGEWTYEATVTGAVNDVVIRLHSTSLCDGNVIGSTTISGSDAPMARRRVDPGTYRLAIDSGIHNGVLCTEVVLFGKSGARAVVDVWAPEPALLPAPLDGAALGS